MSTEFSQPFTQTFMVSKFGKQGKNMAAERNGIAQRALDNLLAKLTEDGWDYIGKHGKEDWEMRLRRIVKQRSIHGF